MEKQKKTIYELSDKELALIKLLIFYWYSNTDISAEPVDMNRVTKEPPLEFIKEQLEKLSENPKSLEFPKEFLELVRETFGADLEDLISNSKSLDVVCNMGSLESINAYDNPLITKTLLSPLTEESSKRYLSIDLGIKNPVTAVDSKTGHCMILGRDYMSRSYYFDNKIAELKNQYIIHGLENFETKRMKLLKKKKNNTLNDILNKITRYLTNYCVDEEITLVVVGDIKERSGSLFPFNSFCKQLGRKLKGVGIQMVKQDEHYTSQCSPDSPEVSEKYATKEKRLKRGLFKDGKRYFNADGLSAFNILKRYLNNFGKTVEIPLEGIISPTVVIVSD